MFRVCVFDGTVGFIGLQEVFRRASGLTNKSNADLCLAVREMSERAEVSWQGLGSALTVDRNINPNF